MALMSDELAELILVEYRWVVVLVALLPMSLAWKLWAFVRNYVVFRMNTAPKMHDKKVRNVQRQVKAWLNAGKGTKLCTARPTWQTMSFRQGLYKKTYTNIDVNLVDVLDVDTKNMTVRCEPMVTMGQLSRTLGQLGLSLPVVPELDQLTVGGLVMGTGVESSSHVHGLFQHICLKYELVLADGSVVTCSENENQDLFYAVPWSYGTLGFLTAVDIKVIPAKKYVRLEYHPYDSLQQLTERFTEESEKAEPHQFVECLLYSKDEGVLMLGDMVDDIQSDGQYNAIGRWYAEWFFKQVERRLRSNRVSVDYVPLRDYYHRHTRCLFWELQDIVPFGNHPLFRVLCGWLMPPEVSLLKLTQPEAVTRLYNSRHVIQDMLVPVKDLPEAIQLFHDEFEVYPIWLCPFKLLDRPGQLRVRGTGPQMFVDIGVYGVPKAKAYETERSTRQVEAFVRERHGFQMLYADTFATLEEFRAMYDHTLYDRVRQSLPHCRDAFPEIYGKVNRSVRK